MRHAFILMFLWLIDDHAGYLVRDWNIVLSPGTWSVCPHGAQNFIFLSYPLHIPTNQLNFSKLVAQVPECQRREWIAEITQGKGFVRPVRLKEKGATAFAYIRKIGESVYLYFLHSLFLHLTI